MNNSTPYIPEMITVHIGTPDEEAKNITIPFPEYIMNVASSSLNPNWPENLLMANIYNIVSIALNRIYNNYYRSKGYNFDITDSEVPGYQYIDGHVIYENIRSLVGNIYNNYLTGEGAEPFYMTGSDGMNELTGEEALNIAGQSPEHLDILKKLSGNEIGITKNTLFENSKMNPPTSLPFSFNSIGNDVRNIQIELNRISANYPTIPKIPVTDGLYSYETEEAVKEFQRIFGLPETGVIDQSTWYEIFRIYSAISRQHMLNSQVINNDNISQQFPGLLSPGSTGNGVKILQYYINFLSQYYRSIPRVLEDGIYGDETLAAVTDMQRTLGLNTSGVVDRENWETMYDAYLGIINKTPKEYINGNALPFAGTGLSLGMSGEQVRIIQEYLNYISDRYPEIPHEPVTGYFGTLTNEAVLAIQKLLGLPLTGIVDETTWNTIAQLYSDIYHGAPLREGQYPGYDIGDDGTDEHSEQDKSDAVKQVQKYLNAIAMTDTDIMKVPVDGIYGTDTRNAVTEFQKKAGLDPTGIVDRETWDMLNNTYKKEQEKRTPLSSVCTFPAYPADYTIKHGDTGFPVSMIQFLLQEISLDYDFEPHVTITGIYDEATENAVKAFQESNMLPVTGIVDRQTWCRIADYFNATKSEYSQ